MISKAIRAMALTLRESPQHAAFVAHGLDLIAQQMDALELHIKLPDASREQINAAVNDEVKAIPPQDLKAWREWMETPR